MSNGIWIVKGTFSWTLNGQTLTSRETIAKASTKPEADKVTSNNHSDITVSFHEYDKPECGVPSYSERLEYAY